MGSLERSQRGKERGRAQDFGSSKLKTKQGKKNKQSWEMGARKKSQEKGLLFLRKLREENISRSSYP